MKRAFLFYPCLFLALLSQAQVKCNVNKAYAYFTVIMPGTQMVDEKGNAVPPVPHVERFIYLDARGTAKPLIKAVLYDNKPVTATITRLYGNNVAVGKKAEDQKGIMLKNKKGNAFWKLELNTPDGKPMDAGNCSNIVVQLRSGGKTCSYKISSETQLYTPPSY
jgi:hypothetical protein